MTINELNKWQDTYRSMSSYGKKQVSFEAMKTKMREEGLSEATDYLVDNHIVSRMRDGNSFVAWSKNNYYDGCTFIDLKAELSGTPRQPTLEERVAILEETIKQLAAKLS